MVCPYFLCKRKETLDDCCDMQRRGGRSSGDVQVLRLDDDGQGSRTEYMKVRKVILTWLFVGLAVRAFAKVSSNIFYLGRQL